MKSEKKPIKRTQKEAPLFLTIAEVWHLKALLDQEKESGAYYGPREQYYARTIRLQKKLTHITK